MISRTLWNDIAELSKLRIALMALCMGALGFGWATIQLGSGFDWTRFAFTMLGMGLVGACSGALNQLMEIEQDSRMRRTANRPLVAGRVSRSFVLWFSLCTGLAGEFVLLAFVNPVTAVLGALTLLFYLGIYTPSKQVSSLSTVIGAVPGAIPPLMGWTAAFDIITPSGIVLFAILFLWQIPHFLAIAWLYRNEYRNASFPVLTVSSSERDVLRQVVLYSIALIIVSLLPVFWGISGELYFLGAFVLGILFLFFGILLFVYRDDRRARYLFRFSLVYLPSLAVVLLFDAARV